jgi:hypothetical protein
LQAFNARVTRLAIAYLIAINVFGLVSVLTFVVLALLNMAQVFALAGLLLGIALAVVAGVRTDKALKGFFQKGAHRDQNRTGSGCAR